MSGRTKIILATVVTCVILTPIILVVRHWANDASNGTLAQHPAQQPQVTAATTPLSITTKYFSAILPGDFTIRSQTDTAADTHIQLRLVATTSSQIGQQFALTRGSLPTDGLRGIADYNLRVTDTNTYTKFTPPTIPTGAQAFRNIQDPAAITLFWPHNGYYAELAFSSNGGASFDQLQATYQQVIQSWQWH